MGPRLLVDTHQLDMSGPVGPGGLKLGGNDAVTSLGNTLMFPSEILVVTMLTAWLLSSLFHCNLQIVTGQNDASSCFGSKMINALPVCHKLSSHVFQPSGVNVQTNLNTDVLDFKTKSKQESCSSLQLPEGRSEG